jgi:hypothetical protein
MGGDPLLPGDPAPAKRATSHGDVLAFRARCYGNLDTQQHVGGKAEMTDTTFPVGTTVAEAEHRTHLRRAVVASTVGTTIEWYDFLIYSTMTGLVFGRIFFAGSDPLIDTLKAFGVFFIGFVARPIGAAIFGHYGDRIGRKATLIVTLLMTGLATAAVGLVPGYDMIGL